MNLIALFVGGSVFLASMAVFILICFQVVAFIDTSNDWVGAAANTASAFGTFIAAGTAVGVVVWQKQIEMERLQDVLKRRDHAARALLSVSLVLIDDYMNECVRYLRSAAGRQGAGAPRLPAFPVDAMPNFRECLEFATESNRLKLAKMLENLQVFDSRFRGAVEDMRFGSLSNNVDSILEDAVVVCYVFSRLFNYARDLSSDSISEFNKDDLAGVARRLKISRQNFPGVYIKINGRASDSWDI